MGELVVKDNALISASYNLDLVEQRLVLLAIIEARETGKGINANDALTVHAESYAVQFGVHRNTAYEALKTACNNLFTRQFSYQKLNQRGNVEHCRSRWVSEIAYIENEAAVRLIFAPAIVPMITLLEQQFTKYDIDQVSHLKSAYAVRLYELLIQWRSVGHTPVFDVAEFRRKLGVSDQDYPMIADFKKRVLHLSINQINHHTDIHVEYAQHKQGRVIQGFSFCFDVRQGKHCPAVSMTAHSSSLAPNSVLSDDGWDKLHEMELRSCQERHPTLCRADVEMMAKQQNTSVLLIMQKLRANQHTTPLHSQ